MSCNLLDRQKVKDILVRGEMAYTTSDTGVSEWNLTKAEIVRSFRGIYCFISFGS
jgi:hypothetical protein